VRVASNGARLEIAQAQMALFVEKREEILAALGADFNEITLNLRLRKGLEG